MSEPTTTIAVGADLVTLINVFTVDPSRQREFVDALDRSTTELFVRQPGFRSANLHASLDGTRVVNYAQWASVAAYQDVLRDPEIQAHMAKIAAIAEKFEPRLYTVSRIHHAAG